MAILRLHKGRRRWCHRRHWTPGTLATDATALVSSLKVSTLDTLNYVHSAVNIARMMLQRWWMVHWSRKKQSWRNHSDVFPSRYSLWVLTLPLQCFFCLALEFWNHTCVTLLLRPVTWAILSRSWPSGLLSSWKFACRTDSCSSVNVVLTLLALLAFPPSESPSSDDDVLLPSTTSR